MTALSTRLQPLFEKTKTVCFGHFLLEVPSTATVVFGPAHVESPITYFPGEGDKVAQHLAALLREVEADRRFLDQVDLAKLSKFGKVEDGAMPGQKLIFGSKDHTNYSVDSLIPLGPDLFIQHADGALSLGEEISSLNAVARSLRLRAESEIPEEPGACIEGGFVSFQPEYERIGLGVRLKEFPDVHFSIDATKKPILVASDALEPRLVQAEKDARREGLGLLYSRIKTFRRGPRKVDDWNGFEVLARKPANGDETEAHEFLFLSQGSPNDPLRPVLDVQFNTGVGGNRTASVKPSLNDEEAVALWDKLITSIRVRPTGDAAKTSTATPPKTPLGAYIDSGAECPHSGWWRCSDSGEVAGGRRRHFVEGDVMPPVVVLGKPDVWQKIRGQRPGHEIPTVWELMEYDQVSGAEDATPDAGPPNQA